MQELTGQYPAALVPTSQSAGGEVHDSTAAMTAPGSQPVSAPAPENPGQAPETLPEPAGRPYRDDAGRFRARGGDDGAAGTWARPGGTGQRWGRP